MPRRTGLVRRCYLPSADGTTAGGVSLWNAWLDAERICTAEWRQLIAKTYGAERTVEEFETPVIVDTQAGSSDKEERAAQLAQAPRW